LINSSGVAAPPPLSNSFNVGQLIFSVKTKGSCGNANGGKGFQFSDFEMPMYMYGTPHNPNVTGTILNGEPGLVGNECNTTNNFQNCGTLNQTDRTPIYAYPGVSPTGAINSPATFYNWWHSTNENQEVPYNLTLNLVAGTSREYTFQQTYFFPVDNLGWSDHALGCVSSFRVLE
jgi:hypothetical protein